MVQVRARVEKSQIMAVDGGSIMLAVLVQIGALLCYCVENVDFVGARDCLGRVIWGMRLKIDN